MFPTILKVKIASTLAFPLNATLISEALADVPQANDIGITFTYWQSTVSHRKMGMPCTVFGVAYSAHAVTQFTPHHIEELELSRPHWSVIVQPVPSRIKHHARDLLQAEGLSKVRTWLLAWQPTSPHRFLVIYDEVKDELFYAN